MEDIIIQGAFILLVFVDLAYLVLLAQHKEHIQKLEQQMETLLPKTK